MYDHKIPGAYAAFFKGGAQFFGFWVYVPRSSMSRAVARGVWEHAPPRKLKKWCNFVRLEGYFQPLS